MKTAEKMKHNRQCEQGGATLLVVAGMMIMFVAFMAMAVDIAHLYVVRNELQNAADAAALAGANYFYPKTPSGFSSTPPSPDWHSAENGASALASSNKSDGMVLVDYVVESGYWNLARTPYGLQNKAIFPGASDAPAVQVTVQRTAGMNGGPVHNFFASVIGMSASSVGVRATAVCAFPGIVQPGPLLPVAISKEIADQAGSYNGPKNIATIGSSYHYPSSLAGQWTSFELDTNNVDDVRDLIQNGNPTALSIGDPIWIQPGVKNTLYDNKNHPSISDYIGQDVVLPVVDAVLSDSTHSAVPIYAFIGFHITDAVGKKNKWIKGYFVENVYVGASGPGGPYYGASAPPVLVQ